jgi:acyl-[acyl-carrier-protein]-phospholipid O-acyltransferase/long-chain-fatty-acid--[acyl-carrier-protein] ligase
LPRWLELPGLMLARLLYRVRSSGAENVPARGGVLLIANHLSYADVVVLQMACPRPLRFMGYRGPRDPPFFELIFRMAGVIAIGPGRPTEGIRRAIKALAAGDCVCLFPEGHISRTGELMGIKKGFELIARRAGVPVVPAAVDGLWGSIFSFAGNRYLWKPPRLMPTDVFVAFGLPTAPGRADAAWARRALLDLGAEAFAERPALKRHLGGEAVRALAKRPGRIAVIDRTAQRRALTAGRLLAAAAVLSRRIRADVPERRVGIVLPPGAGAFIANLAVICAGKVPVNLNFTAGRAAIEAGLEIGGIRAVISADAMRARAPDFPWPERTLDLRAELEAAGGRPAMLPWLAAIWLLPNQWIPPLLGLPHSGGGAEAALLFTSGSAGEPKGVVLSHRNILANCAQFSATSILRPSCVLLGCLPLFHSFGFTVTLWYPLLRGSRVVTVPSPLETRRLVEAIDAEKATVLIGAPTFLRPFLKKARSAELRSLDLVVTGAEKLPDDLRRGFLEHFHLAILQGYGLTEASPAVSVNQPDPPVTTSTAEPQIGKKDGSVGRLLPGMTARIADPDSGEELPLTSTGLVRLRGANIFTGYLGDEARTRAVLRDGWLETGDVGRFDDDGFLTIEGRLSRFSKIGGEMVPHGVVEQRIIELFELDVTDEPLVAVVGVAHAAKGEALVLLTAADLSAEAIRAKLLPAGLPALWLPKLVRRVDRIPMLGSGKLDLARCRELADEIAKGSGRQL